MLFYKIKAIKTTELTPILANKYSLMVRQPALLP